MPPAPAPKEATPPAPAPKEATPPAPAPKEEVPPAPAPKEETPPASVPLAPKELKVESPPRPRLVSPNISDEGISPRVSPGAPKSDKDSPKIYTPEAKQIFESTLNQAQAKQLDKLDKQKQQEVQQGTRLAVTFAEIAEQVKREKIQMQQMQLPPPPNKTKCIPRSRICSIQ